MFHLRTVPDASELTLSGPEGRHAALVRRLRPGERLDVTDGLGVVAECTVTRCRREELDCVVERRVVHSVPDPRLVVVQALAKGDRGELAVELMTEVGVDEIVPWSASRSIVRWDGERGVRACGRWLATAREAAKQSRRVFWPLIADLADTPAVAARLAAAEVALVLHEAAAQPLASAVPRVLPDDASPGGRLVDPGRSAGPGEGRSEGPMEIILVVGPEGGIADDELELFAAAGARPVRLGPTVLRTSTAGAVSAAVALSRTSRWGAVDGCGLDWGPKGRTV